MTANPAPSELMALQPPASRHSRTTSAENPWRRTPTPNTATRPPSSARQTRTSRSASERPMTANKGAGFNSKKKVQSKSPSQDLASEGQKSEDEEREERLRNLENEVQQRLRLSALSASDGDFAKCLHSAKEASELMQGLTNLILKGDERCVELKASVRLSLGVALELNGLFEEAAETYKSLLSENEQGTDSSRFRVNLGNLHFRKKEFPAALKMYRMALDRVSESQRTLKAQIMKNIGVVLMKMGRVRESVEQYEQIVEDHLMDLQVASNLCIGYTKLGNTEALKGLFIKLLAEFPNLDQDSTETEDLDSNKNSTKFNNCILTCGKILAARLEEQGAGTGYDWCIQELRKTAFHFLAKEFLLEKANSLLRTLKLQEAVNIYKDLAKMSQAPDSRISKILASVFLLQEDLTNAWTYAEQSVALDRYSHQSWVIKGIASYKRSELTQAKLHFEESLRLEPESIEALYNLGLVFKAMAQEQKDQDLNSQFLQFAYSTFLRVHHLIPENPETLFQLGSLCEVQFHLEDSIKWFQVLHSLVPEDASVLRELGALHFTLEDEVKALNYYQESYSVFPYNLETLCWLAAFYSKNEMFEKALEYFHLAAELQPDEVKWKLMAASCLRRAGNFSEAHEAYIKIHKTHPQNLECLRFLVQLCEEDGVRSEFEEKLQQVQKTQVKKEDSLDLTNKSLLSDVLANAPEFLNKEPEQELESSKSRQYPFKNAVFHSPWLPTSPTRAIKEHKPKRRMGSWTTWQRPTPFITTTLISCTTPL